MAGVRLNTSDVAVRSLSALIMVAVAATALWLGGWYWTGLVALVALGVVWEWCELVLGLTRSAIGRLIWTIGGVVYVGIAASGLAYLRIVPVITDREAIVLTLTIILPVIATDIGAYFAGRTIGGPKIAPAISPSKTWAGLFGAIVLASLALVLLSQWSSGGAAAVNWREAVLGGLVVAVVAQAGDFFESWMKRRAGVKDSGTLIPGHGGVLDRLDGVVTSLPVAALLVWLGF
jgi:phosphatidate cytidylyltransferase